MPTPSLITRTRRLASSVISGQPAAGEVDKLRTALADLRAAPSTESTREAIQYAEDALASVGSAS